MEVREWKWENGSGRMKMEYENGRMEVRMKWEVRGRVRGSIRRRRKAT